MQIGVMGGAVSAGPMDRIVDNVRAAADDGLTTFWLPQHLGVDALTALAVIGREVPGMELATGVVPIQPRHPVALAAQALTVQDAVGGRLTLAIGLSHRVVIEGVFGMSFDRPVTYMEEYLDILLPLIRGEAVSARNERVSAEAKLGVRSLDPIPVLIAALGPRMLDIAGSRADGTVTWLAGPKTIETAIVPAIRAAAERASRPAPRVTVGLPVCVTDDVAAARERAARSFGYYAALPSYRAMLDREGVHGPADVAIIGDPDSVRADLEHLIAIGATDFMIEEFGASEDRTRTRSLLASMARSGS